MNKLLLPLVLCTCLLCSCTDPGTPTDDNQTTVIGPIHKARDAAAKQEQRLKQQQEELHKQ